jgi:hypothetical protein
MSWDINLYVTVDGHTVELPETWVNYTHNCNRMIRFAGLVEWPYEVAGWQADRLGRRLREVLVDMEANPATFRAMDPDNGWGSYDSLVPVLRKVAEMCERFPSATVRMCA